MEQVAKLWNRFSYKEKLFFCLAALCSFLISADYAIVRPVSQSVFVHFFGSKSLPYVWLCSIPLNLCVVSLYNRFVPKIGCFKFFILSSLCIAGVNSLATFFLDSISWCAFFLYIWKEVYILLMFQQLWAIIHSTMKQKEAKYLYGVLFGFGALGGFVGSLIPGFWAATFGSESLLICSSPIYVLLVFAYFYLLKYSGSGEERVEAEKTKSFASLLQGVGLIRASSLLKAILALCVLMQVTATFADFQFQTSLAESFPDKDLRTECMGKLSSFGNIITMALQFIGTFVLIRLFGLQRAHLLVPSALCLGVTIFLCAPSFYVISSFFVVLKALEFSLFTVIKEMLYIPMRLEEKFQAKPIIDVFMGRFAKIGASICILAVQFFCPSYTMPIVASTLLALLLGWIYLVLGMKSHYEKSDPKEWIGQQSKS